MRLFVYVSFCMCLFIIHVAFYIRKSCSVIIVTLYTSVLQKRDDQKVLSPCTLGMTKNKNFAIIFNIISLCLSALSPMLFKFAYPFKIEAFFLVSIYDALIASKIPTTKVSFQIWKQKSEGPKSGEYRG